MLDGLALGTLEVQRTDDTLVEVYGERRKENEETF